MRKRFRREAGEMEKYGAVKRGSYNYWYNSSSDPFAPPIISEGWYNLDDGGIVPQVHPRTSKYEFILDSVAMEMQPSLFELKLKEKGLFTWYTQHVSKEKRYRMKPCRHIRKEYSNDVSRRIGVGHPKFYATYGPTGTTYQHRLYALEWDLFHPTYSDSLAPPIEETPESRFLNPLDFFGTDLHHAVQRTALSYMLPDLENGFSLPVFLYELKDLPRMVNGLFSILTDAPSALRELFKKPFRQWSKAHLSLNFGWIPFVRDLRKLINRLLYLEQDLTRFFKQMNKRMTYFRSTEISPTYFKPEEWWVEQTLDDNFVDLSVANEPFCWLSPDFVSMGYKRKQLNSVGPIIYTATIDYMYHVPNMDQWASLLAALDRFGVNPSLSDIWEVLPFSFVVDWVYPVQDMLKRFDKTNLDVQIVINDFCESLWFGYTERRFLELSSLNPNDSHWPSDGWTFTPGSASVTYHEDAYYRRTGIPRLSPVDFPDFRLPSGRQIVLGAALIGSRT